MVPAKEGKEGENVAASSLTFLFPLSGTIKDSLLGWNGMELIECPQISWMVGVQIDAVIDYIILQEQIEVVGKGPDKRFPLNYWLEKILLIVH